MAEAFTPELVRRVTGLSQRQLDNWSSLGLVSPSLFDETTPGLPRLYSFRDLIKLRVAAEMRRRHVLPGQMKRAIDELEVSGIDDPLLTLRIVGDPDGGRAFWIDPRSREPMSWTQRGQVAQVFDLPLKDLRSGLEAKLVELTKREKGKIETIRGIQGSRPVIAGTRIPAAKVASLLMAGWTVDEVVAAFPILTRRDVSAARRFQSEQQRLRTA